MILVVKVVNEGGEKNHKKNDEAVRFNDTILDELGASKIGGSFHCSAIMYTVFCLISAPGVNEIRIKSLLIFIGIAFISVKTSNFILNSSLIRQNNF